MSMVVVVVTVVMIGGEGGGVEGNAKTNNRNYEFLAFTFSRENESLNWIFIGKKNFCESREIYFCRHCIS